VALNWTASLYDISSSRWAAIVSGAVWDSGQQSCSGSVGWATTSPALGVGTTGMIRASASAVTLTQGHSYKAFLTIGCSEWTYAWGHYGLGQHPYSPISTSRAGCDMTLNPWSGDMTSVGFY
ncbi:MAG: hypothetical protein L3K05_03010, partial [Thermoplasmata archaeon]|nr:hypothetical protein [Thermoplasmata archaeon]